MKVREYFFLVLFFVSSVVQAQEYCKVRIYRPKKTVGSAVGFRIYLNKTLVHKIKSGRKVSLNVRPGKEAVISIYDGTKNDPVPVRVKFVPHPDSVYYFRLDTELKDYRTISPILTTTFNYETAVISMPKELGEKEWGNSSLFKNLSEEVYTEKETLYND